jgi:hypothetical protein
VNPAWDEVLWQEVYEQMLDMGIDEFSAEVLTNEQFEYAEEEMQWD